MKTLALILPPDLTEDGKLLPWGADMLRCLTEIWRDKYRITIILWALPEKTYDGLPEGAEVLTDTATVDLSAQSQSTYMQRGLAAWENAPTLPGFWDCVISLDGLHPWCLATGLYRVQAARRMVFLPCEPRLYLSGDDAPAYAPAYARADSVLCASRWTQENFEDMFPQIDSVLAHPRHSAPGIAAAKEFASDKLHILTVEPLTEWHQAERIPVLAAAVKETYPSLRWHILGEGPRQPYLLRDIILYDVCEEVFPEGMSNRINALLPMCDGVVHFNDENTGVAASAQALGIPVLSLRPNEGAETLVAWLSKLQPSAKPRQPVWLDEHVWTTMIEGE